MYNRFEKLTDIEINGLVSHLISSEGILDYCGDIKNAWPVIFEFGISLINIGSTTMYLACDSVRFENICMSPDGNDNGVTCFDADSSTHHVNPLRAAMITFLMKRELLNNKHKG